MTFGFIDIVQITTTKFFILLLSMYQYDLSDEL